MWRLNDWVFHKQIFESWVMFATKYNGEEYWIKGYDKQLKEKYDQIVAKRRKK